MIRGGIPSDILIIFEETSREIQGRTRRRIHSKTFGETTAISAENIVNENLEGASDKKKRRLF